MRRSTLRAGATLRMVWYELCMHCAACLSMRVISMSCCAVVRDRDCDYILSSSRLASSKPRNVAPFANGDLGIGTGAASAGRPSVWDPRRRAEMAGAGAGTGTEGKNMGCETATRTATGTEQKPDWPVPCTTSNHTTLEGAFSVPALHSVGDSVR